MAGAHDTADLNGDSTSEILSPNDAGDLIEWFMSADHQWGGGCLSAQIGNEWAMI